MKKTSIKIIFIIFLFTINTFSYADEEKSIINSINYTGNLSEDTVININGTKLEQCGDIIIKGEKKVIKEKTDSLLSIDFSNIGIYNGYLEVTCGTDKIIKDFNFPYIKDISGLKKSSDNKQITITGKNLGKNSNIIINGGSFEKQVNENGIIIGKIPTNITNEEIYVEVEGLKSNLINLELKIPKINFIYSEKGFANNSEFFIYGDNLNYYEKSYISIGDEKITDFEYNKDKGYISFISNDNLGTKKIKIVSNGFESNGIDINISGDTPFIEKINEVNINEKIDGVNKSKNLILIEGINIPLHIDDITIYNNGNIINSYKKEGNKIYIDIDDINSGNNFIQLSVNGVKSNIKNKLQKYKLPQVTGITIGSPSSNKRQIRVYLDNYIKETDYILFNNSQITPVGCFGNMCRIEINDSDLKGSITVGRGIFKNLNYKTYDISFENTPYIDNINIKGDLKQGTKIEISGRNFLNSTISSSNLFTLNDKGELDLDITNYIISGRIPLSYDINSQSTFSVNKYGQTSDISFILNDIIDNKIYGKAFINKITPDSNEGLFKRGGIINISGIGFKKGDSIIIGSLKTILNVESSSKGSFVIPNGINDGEETIYIENTNGLRSNGIKIIIVPEYFKPNIMLKSDDIIKKDFYNGEQNTDSLYNLNISNKIKDIIVKNISFKVIDYKKENQLGTFKLMLNSTEVGKALISEDGLITFNGYFEINKYISSSKLSLVKDSEFSNNKSFKVTLNEDDLSIVDSIERKYFTNITFDNLTTNSINIFNKAGTTCIDILNDNSNCNSFITLGKLKEKEIEVEKKSIQIKTEIDNKNENKEPVKISVYDKIDSISNKIFSSKSKLSKKEQVNYYKDLKFKITKVIKKYNNKPSKKYIEYFYNNVNSQYKKAFKEYILSK